MIIIKVLTIMTTPIGKTGISTVVKNYYKYIDKNNFSIDFVFPNSPDKELRKKIESNDGTYFVLNNRMKNIFKYMAKLNKVIEKGQYDIVHAHGNSHTLAIEMGLAKKNGVKVRIPHSHSTTTKFPFIHKILTPVFNGTYTHGLACGHYAGKWLYGSNKFEVVDNGIAVDFFKFDDNIRNNKRKELGINKKDILIGNIGTIDENKNQIFLIELLHELVCKEDKNYKLLIIGEGPLQNTLKRKVEKLALENDVIFLRNRMDVPDLMKAMDIFIMPSYFEGLPLTLIEAQAADLNSLVSDTITKEVNITNQLTYFSLEEDSSAIVKKIKKSLSSTARRYNHWGYKQIKESKYNIDEAVKKLENLYFRYYIENN